MKAKYQFFIGILVLILVLIGLTRATEALATSLQAAGLSEEISHLIIAASFSGVAGLGIYWLYPVTVRAYPKSYAAIPEMKIPFTVWCILLAINPWLEFAFRRMGLENTVCAWLLIDHFDLFTFVGGFAYVIWMGMSKKALFKAPGSNPERE
jgi:hypothetical protein